MISATMVAMTKTILSAIKNALARVAFRIEAVSYTHLRAHETGDYLV